MDENKTWLKGNLGKVQIYFWIVAKSAYNLKPWFFPMHRLKGENAFKSPKDWLFLCLGYEPKTVLQRHIIFVKQFRVQCYHYECQFLAIWIPLFGILNAETLHTNCQTNVLQYTKNWNLYCSILVVKMSI